MCLTGVDYFSTLGYLPGIAFLAAGLLSPVATLIVVLVTLFGLVPLYARVAKESPFGQGSISMLENALPGWLGKSLVLVLLGFAATDFVITITLSAADATAHIVENPGIAGLFIHDRIGVTIVLLCALGIVFLKGFREAIGISIFCVALYLVCNLAVVIASIQQIVFHPALLVHWEKGMMGSHGSIWSTIGVACILFPKLALGMSGFETGVTVMPMVKGGQEDTEDDPRGRITNTRKLLLTAAVIMSVLLLVSSFVTTVLIAPQLFAEGGEANGRALAYLAHKYLGETFGTVYDFSTIMILCFAGASAMAGLLSLVPRYLPRYGMAPGWSQAQRPLVVFFIIVTVTVTVAFHADVDAQAGAYATGVLVLFASAALAVVLSVWREGWKKRLAYSSILIVMLYTAFANFIERPEGLHIASFFIGTILITSLISRSIRSFELRVSNVKLDSAAKSMIDEAMAKTGQICLIASRPDSPDYRRKEQEIRILHKLSPGTARFIFFEVTLSDPSQFEGDCLFVTGHNVGEYSVLRCQGPAVPNAIAAFLLYLRDTTGSIPHAYLGWTEGHPLACIFRYVFLGEGGTAPFAREILRAAEENPIRRPKILVG